MAASLNVSVIIPLYNRASLVSQTLRCLAPDLHDGVRLEVFVVDDGSTDDGAEVAARAMPDAVIRRVPHGGAAKARNIGLREAKGDFILLIDSDDLIEPGFFLARLRALENSAQADAAYGPWECFRGDADFNANSVAPRFASYPIEVSLQARSHLLRLLRGWYIAPHSLLWKAEALRRVGGYAEALTVNQDVDLLFRLLTSGSGIVGCDAPLALYREHDGPRQGSLSTREKAVDLLRLRERFVDALSTKAMLDQPASDALGAFCFDQWRALRSTFPDVAASFLQLSRRLNPCMRLPGRWPLRILARIIGPVAAVRLRDAL